MVGSILTSDQRELGFNIGLREEGAGFRWRRKADIVSEGETAFHAARSRSNKPLFIVAQLHTGERNSHSEIEE